MRAKRGLIAGFITTLALLLALPLPAYAHGAKIEYTIGVTVEITAAYDRLSGQYELTAVEYG